MKLRTSTLAATALLMMSAMSLRAQDVPQADTLSYRVYVVKWYEDLDDVAEKFGMSKEVLMRFNKLESDKLSRRQRLRIPDDPSAVPPPEVPGDLPWNAADSTGTMTEDSPDSVAEAKYRVDAALLLPFSGGRDGDAAYDFYAGVLLAAKDLRDAGLDTRLHVMDIGGGHVSWANLLGMNLAIGPVSPADIDSVRRICPKNCAVISPLDPKGAALARLYPNVIQAPASTAAQDAELLSWIREDMMPYDRLIVLRESGSALTAVMDVIAASGMEFKELDYGILEGRGVIDRIEALMTRPGVNRVVIASDNEAFVNDALRNVNLMKFRGYDVVLYSHSRIRGFETIEVENLHKVNAHVVCGYFVDYGSERVKNFIMRYRALFGTEPTPFAYQGYDTTWYFVSSFATTENLRRRMERLGRSCTRGLQSDFRPVRSGEGWSNNAVRRIVYGENYSIELL